ncbi:MAG TPA: hypothetical protein VER55_13215 [Ardenticatenaceae bacterium]|nr:hypothetical protein [Ardenticatenaceae bacterium]
MDYPLTLSFKIVALAPQLSVVDAHGNLLFYVKQKLLKLKESVTVFGDVEQTRPLYTINADRVLDFSAQYRFADQHGRPLGAVKRHGMKSLWKANYNVLDGDSVVMTISEENPWVKVLDALLGEVPILGFFTGYFLHPAYQVSRPDGSVVLRLEKQPAFLEGRFTIEQKALLGEDDERRALLSLLMLVLLERGRG